ncbi:hypothetical protein J8F10_22495 [Gemmata sp. G18]|uniref:Uncharacterized protein n=1 Tax=Gemmata palustris TaxID=2822762 RepID=A0ABS5BWJ0_9BACT|nr:hypothetical protein [Gemmata palustris]MBP3958035.1 hypothetical protein [Gemmata palustris]
MPAYDIILDNEGDPQIAVLTTTVKSDLDKDKLKLAVASLKRQGKVGQDNLNKNKGRS